MKISSHFQTLNLYESSNLRLHKSHAINCVPFPSFLLSVTLTLVNQISFVAGGSGVARVWVDNSRIV